MFDRILVAFDGSSQARRAVHVATEVAGRFHASLTLAVVRAPGPAGADSYLESLVPLSDEGKTLASVVEEVREKALAHGAAAVESVLLQGEVVGTLLAWLERHPQDLLVVGSRGLSRGRRLLLGSVSSGLVSEAPCPVLVVRPARDHRKGDVPGSLGAPGTAHPVHPGTTGTH
jgi:nucleotide-binding universal stress UspA family protein